MVMMIMVAAATTRATMMDLLLCGVAGNVLIMARARCKADGVDLTMVPKDKNQLLLFGLCLAG